MTISARISGRTPQSLLDHIVDGILDTGVPLTEGAVLDLLSTLRPSQIVGMTASAAIVADKLSPTKAVLSTFTDEELLASGDTVVEIGGQATTVAAAMTAGVAPDFVLASVKMPKEVCRWYTLHYLSLTGALPQSVQDINAASSQLESEFSDAYLYQSVSAYLDASPDLTWLSLMGLDGVATPVPGVVTSTRILIEGLIKVLSTDTTTSISVDPVAKDLIVQCCTRLGVNTLMHYRQVQEIRRVYESFALVVASYAKTPAALDGILAALRAELVARGAGGGSA